jgi:hypothetical protein
LCFPLFFLGIKSCTFTSYQHKNYSSWWVIATTNMYLNSMWMRFISLFQLSPKSKVKKLPQWRSVSFHFFDIKILGKCKPQNSKLPGIYTWKINSKTFPISLWKNGRVSLGTSTWSFLGQTNSWVMREDSCTFGKYQVNYTPETQES